MEGLEKKVALVTGGGRGIGRAIALALASEGANLVVNDINLTIAKSVADEIKRLGHDALAWKADISSYDEDRAMVQAAIKKFGGIDILVNNAGIAYRCPAEEIELSQWNKMIDVCLSGTFFLCQIVGREMIKVRRGKIINISSMSGIYGPIFMADYAAAKHGIVGLTKALGVEWAKYNIHVNCICPGITSTEMSKEWQTKYPLQFEQRKARIPLRRLAKPDDIAKAAIFLASSDSDYITGSSICVDGGNGALFSGYSLE